MKLYSDSFRFDISIVRYIGVTLFPDTVYIINIIIMASMKEKKPIYLRTT